MMKIFSNPVLFNKIVPTSTIFLLAFFTSNYMDCVQGFAILPWSSSSSTFHRGTSPIANKIPSTVSDITIRKLPYKLPTVPSFSLLNANTNNLPNVDEFSAVNIITNTQEAEGLRLLTIEVPDRVASAYIHPGQYVKLRSKNPDAKPSFFAIASPPDGRNVFTFLVKDTPNNQFILSPEIYTASGVEISLPQGRGFQIEEYFENYKSDFPTTNILLFATGSGLAPIVAALESQYLKLKTVGYTSLYARQALLYYGVRTPRHIALSHRFQEWENIGVKVIPVISKPTLEESKGWTGRTGYVQDALREDGVKVPRNTGVLLCGQRDMTENVKGQLLEAGVFEGRILLNF